MKPPTGQNTAAAASPLWHSGTAKRGFPLAIKPVSEKQLVAVQLVVTGNSSSAGYRLAG